MYAKLQTYLSNIHPTVQNPDVFTAMMDRIKSMAKYHAEFVELIYPQESRIEMESEIDNLLADLL